MKSRKLALFIVSLLIIPNVGCQCWHNVRDSFYYCEPIDEAIHSYNCHRAAKHAWKARGDRFCDRERLDHFGAGFRAGYADVALGGTGCPPPLPPRCYWGWRYQNCEGQQSVASWFDGYPAGARAAEEDGVSNWSRMQTSYIIDAQYAARMPGARRGGPLPPVGGFPGEEVLEEVPAAPIAAPAVSDPAVNTAPVTPSNSFVPTTDSNEEVRVLRDLDQSLEPSTKVVELPKIVKRPRIVPAASKLSATLSQAVVTPLDETPTPAETSEPTEEIVQGESSIRRLETDATMEESEPAALRKFEMPVVEILSGVSVPKKQSDMAEEIVAEDAGEIETDEIAPTEETSKEGLDSPKPALMRTPALAPIVAPAAPTTLAPNSSVVEETPAYILDSSDPSSSGGAEPGSRTLPPIVPSKSKQPKPPIVRPVEEQGRFTKTVKPAPTKQVSFESDEIEEVPGLRRIGKSKADND